MSSEPGLKGFFAETDLTTDPHSRELPLAGELVNARLGNLQGLMAGGPDEGPRERQEPLKVEGASAQRAGPRRIEGDRWPHFLCDISPG